MKTNKTTQEQFIEQTLGDAPATPPADTKTEEQLAQEAADAEAARLAQEKADLEDEFAGLDDDEPAEPETEEQKAAREAEEEAARKAAEAAAGTDDDFNLDNDQFEEVTSSPEKLQAYAKRIEAQSKRKIDAELKAMKDEFQAQLARAKEDILKNIPEVVGKATERAQGVKALGEEFYAKYPSLKENRGYVRDMVSIISSQNPNMNAKEVLEQVGLRAERDLKIAAGAAATEKARGSNPVFAGAGGRRAPAGTTDTRTKQQRLLDDTFGTK